MEYIIDFINKIDFENHVRNTLKQYNQTLNSIDLEKFNNNLIDPIKLLFGKNVFNKSYEEIIKLRYKDKEINQIAILLDIFIRICLTI